MIRLGLIGAGPNGTGNVRNLTKHADRTKLVAVADPDTKAAQAIADTFDAETIVGNYEDMLDKVDAVIISSPNWFHPEQAIGCARAGKHLWIEKPMALTTADADHICEAVDAAGVKSFVGFSVRFSTIPRTLKTVYESGEIGRLRSIWSRRLANIFKEGKQGWRADFNRSGGVMAELLAHEIDWLVDIAGDPISVYCRIQADHPTDPRDNDHVWITFAFPDGSTGTIEGAQNAIAADYYKGIIGDKGSVTDRAWGNEAHLMLPDENRQLEPVEEFDKHAHFLDVIDGKAESVADVHHGRKIVYLSEKALESAVTGQIVQL